MKKVHKLSTSLQVHVTIDSVLLNYEYARVPEHIQCVNCNQHYKLMLRCMKAYYVIENLII